MKINWSIKWLVNILILSLITGLVHVAAPVNIYGAEESLTTESKMTQSVIMHRFGVSEAFVQEQINEGNSLIEIYSILFKSEEEQISYDEAKTILFAPEINLSPTVESKVSNNELPINLVLRDASDEPLASQELTEERKKEIKEQELAATKDSKAKSMSVPPLPEIETAPVYTKETMNQAPYSINLSNENISSLSGNLTTQATDMTLPGRNGLSFELIRQYNSDDSAFFGMEYGAENYTYYTGYNYFVRMNVVKRLAKYDVTYREQSNLQFDYNGDGIPDENAFVPSNKTVIYGSYPTEAEAEAVKNNDVYYKEPAESKVGTDYREKSSDDFSLRVTYNQDGFSGLLSKKGGSRIISGSLIPPSTKPATDSCTNKLAGQYDSLGMWYKTGEYTNPCPATMPYSDSQGYSGPLNRIDPVSIEKACASPSTQHAGWICTREWKASYSGTVTKPGSDTRIWRQDYEGTVNKPELKTKIKYGPWRTASNGVRERTYYQIKNEEVILVEEAPTSTTRDSLLVATQSEADFIVSAALAVPANQKLANEGGYNYYSVSNPNPTIHYVPVNPTSGYRYFNNTVQPLQEKIYPIGKGWSWRLPFVEASNGQLRFHSAEGGSYLIENGTLKDYTWLGTVFENDTSVSINDETSAYALSSVEQKIKQYYTNDGRLIRIKDAYNNTIDFKYSQNSTYGRKLLSQVIDSIGNSISITYTTGDVTITKGNEIVKYKKRIESGKELLESVTDQEGRKTIYSYDLAPAKFNLLGFDENRAKSNPFALLTEVQHPTGAITQYSYEDAPKKRYIGESSYQESYRISSRVDKLLYESNEYSLYNSNSVSYIGDYLQSNGQTHNFKTILSNGLTSTVYEYKKQYTSEDQPVQYYLESEITSADGLEKKVTNTYNKKVGNRSYAVAHPTTTIVSNNKNTDTLATNIQFDDYGNVISSVNSNGALTTNVYDPTKKWLLNSRKQVNDTQFLYTQYVRNTKGDVTETIVKKNDNNGEVISHTKNIIDVFGNITSVRLENGNKPSVTMIEYSENHAFPIKQTATVTNVEGVNSEQSTRFTYDYSSGLLNKTIDGEGNEISYVHDKLGRLIKISYPNNLETTAEYNNIENIVTITDEVGRKSYSKYNGLGWIVTEGDIRLNAYDEKSTIHYDQYGRTISIVDVEGNQTQQMYDNWSRLTKVIDANLSEFTTSYNDALREVTKVDAEGYHIFEKQDKFGQVLRKEEGDDGSNRNVLTINEYQPVSGLLLKQTDANQVETSFAYDVLGQLLSVTNSMNEVTSYQYDQLGQHIKTIYPDGAETQKSYNQVGNLIKETDSINGNNIYFYNGNGGLSKFIDKKGHEFNYQYNNRNMLITKQGPTETITFSYNDDGTRSSMSDNTGTTEYDYDPLSGELLEVKYPDLNTISYTYNDYGLRNSAKLPFGDVITYSYDDVNRLDSMSWNGLLQTDYQYYNNGKLKKEEQGNGSTIEIYYSNLSLTGINYLNSSGESEHELNYTYDLNRNITQIKENKLEEQEETFNFTYDILNRIESSSQYNEEYSYDKRGNRQTLTTEAGLLPANNVAYEYDEWNRLSKVTQEDGSIVTYRYNGDNLLIEKTDAGVTTRFYYDGQEIVAEGIVSDEGNVEELVSYMRGLGLAMLEEKDGDKGYYRKNGHGDVIGIYNSQGEALNTYEYDIWGKPTVVNEEMLNSFLYSGEYWDESTQLQYLRARWYEPGMGRFINEDTYQGELSNPLSLNLYTYVYNNPLKYIDPTGHFVDMNKNQQSKGPRFGYNEKDGTLAHQLIQAIFLFWYSSPNDGYEAKVEVSVPVSGNISGYGRADMVLYEGINVEVYEIKPITQAPPLHVNNKKQKDKNIAAKDQLNKYIAGFNHLRYVAEAGTTFNPDGMTLSIPGFDKQMLIIHTYDKDPGMIYYEIKDRPSNHSFNGGLSADAIIAGIVTTIFFFLSRGAGGLLNPKGSAPAMA